MDSDFLEGLPHTAPGIAAAAPPAQVTILSLALGKGGREGTVLVKQTAPGAYRVFCVDGTLSNGNDEERFTDVMTAIGFAASEINRIVLDSFDADTGVWS